MEARTLVAGLVGIGAAGVAAAVAPGLGRAEPPRLEASGFLGVDRFGDHSGLGNSFAPEQIPGTSLLLGGRLTYLALPDLAPGSTLAPQLGVEAELKLAPASTGGSFDGGRPSYFAPVLGWRAHAILRLAGVPVVHPHLVVGGGGETVMSSSPFMAKETDGAVYWGLGVSYPVSARWQLRLDLRHGVTSARDGGLTSTFEFQLGVATAFALPTRRTTRPRIAVVDHAAPATDVAATPPCPTEDEVVRGERAAHDPGCPDLDPDADGIIGSHDRCPLAAEDFDRFEDDDGCPDLDNDRDGVPDARDACPNQAETPNGIDDDDGCPDAVPADVTTRLAAGAKVHFVASRARLDDASRDALQNVLGVLRDHPALRVAILAHAARGPADKAAELALRRAEAIKWFLVDQGIAADRLETSAGPRAAKAPLIELSVASILPPPLPAPPPQP
jgi:OOP family OmpA-OmpF porin